MQNAMKDLHSLWKKEYETPFSGWDFSYLEDRLIFEYPPWDYGKLAKQLIKKSKALLDIGTGGGEFLASLAPLPVHTCATEAWKPNVAIAKAKLEPMGVKVMEIDEKGRLPFSDGEFDTIIDRHAYFTPAEIFRVLRPGGTFLTQQVGGSNLQDFAEAFDTNTPYKHLTFNYWKQEIKDAGFGTIKAEEWRGKQEFKDIGAIVYYIKATPWQAPGFDINKNMPQLDELQHKLDAGEKLIYTQIRFLYQAEKPC